MYLLLGALRRSHVPSTAIRAGKWRGNMGLGHGPEGKVLGILGMGGIGRALALRAVPFGFQIQYHNRRPVFGELNPTNAKYVSFEELLRTSDVISIHLPLSHLTRYMIGQKEFAMMKDGVVVVNTARGSIIDENALVKALDSGKIFGAGLDVFEKEPEIHPGLIEHNNVVLLPHAACLTFEIQVCGIMDNISIGLICLLWIWRISDMCREFLLTPTFKQRAMEILVIDNLRSAIENGSLLTPVAEQQKSKL
jgi:glyoxylate reductase